MKKINEITFADLYNNQDLCMDILLGLYDQDIKKSNKKAGKVVAFKRPKKLPKPVDKKPVAPVIEESVVVSIEEQKPMVPAIEEPVIDMSTTLIDDKEQAIEVIMNQLDNQATDLSEEDFVPEVWAEAWDIANERFYSMADEDYQETVMPGGERIIRMSPGRLSEFMEDRSQTIASWGIEDMSEANDEYIYEDDEVNVPEECDVTILSFRQAFDCMKAEEPAPKSKLDTLLDIIIDNQDEFKDKYERHLAEDDSYCKGCPAFSSIDGIGLTADDLSEKALARTLYREIRRWSLCIKDRYSRRIYESKYNGNELFIRDDLLDTLVYISTYDIYAQVLNFFDIREYKEAV